MTKSQMDMRIHKNHIECNRLREQMEKCDKEMQRLNSRAIHRFGLLTD